MVIHPESSDDNRLNDWDSAASLVLSSRVGSGGSATPPLKIDFKIRSIGVSSAWVQSQVNRFRDGCMLAMHPSNRCTAHPRSATGQKRTSASRALTSASPPETEIELRDRHVRLVP